MTKWDIYFLQMARHVSTRSKDPKRKCGAVIVDPTDILVSTGYNGFPRCIRDRPEDYANKALKLQKIIHAEVNAVIWAKRDLTDHKMYIWPLMPCSRCATIILQTGISMIVYPIQDDVAIISSWTESQSIAVDMFQEGRTKMKGIDVELIGD